MNASLVYGNNCSIEMPCVVASFIEVFQIRMHAEIATGHNVQFLAICVFPVAISSVVSFRIASISHITCPRMQNWNYCFCKSAKLEKPYHKAFLELLFQIFNIAKFLQRIESLLKDISRALVIS